jgi:hypothetical protein
VPIDGVQVSLVQSFGFSFALSLLCPQGPFLLLRCSATPLSCMHEQSWEPTRLVVLLTMLTVGPVNTQTSASDFFG